MHAAACGGLAPARCRNRSIKRHAYAFELRPLWPRNERRASSRAGRAHDGTKADATCMQACQRHAGSRSSGTAAAQRRPAAFGRMSPAIIAEPSFFPSDPSSAFLPVRASLAHTDTSHGSAAGCSSPAALLPLAQAIDVRAMNGHSGKQTWIRREKGTGGEDHPPGRAGHGMDGKREDGRLAS